MDHSDFVNTSLRLRYEVFSTFATQVNQARDLEEIGEAIAAHLKFVLDAFIFRLATKAEHSVYAFELFRGKHTVQTSTTFSEFEQHCLIKGLPLTFSSHDVQQKIRLRGSLFDHPKVTHVMVLPFNASGTQPLILSIANKSNDAYTELDFRFARLIEELLSTKISQLLLLRKIASKNLALEHANQQLSALNREVQILNTELETKVEERTFRLQEAHEELNTLLYRTSHDFRRPLTSILGLAQLLVMSQGPTETVDLVQHLKSTVTGLDNMLIKLQTLMLPQIEEVPGPVLFPELVEGVKQKLQTEIAENNVCFSYRVDQKNEYASYPLIHQAILENLVENAVRYHRTAQPIVHLQIEKRESLLIIQVTDNGEGIPEHLQSVVFDMYVKASNRTQGNGLGLFVVKKLVAALGGTVSFESVLHEGSFFTVRLPYDQAETITRHRAIAAASSHR